MNIIGRYFILSMKKNFAYKVNGVMVIIDTLIDCFSIWLFWSSLLELDLSMVFWNDIHLKMFMGFSLISMSVSNLFVGCSDLEWHIQGGTLDCYLVKPCNSLLLIALERANFLRFSVSFVVGLVLCIKNVPQAHEGYLIFAILICIMATIVIEMFQMIFNELAFFLKKTETMSDIIGTFLGISKYPLVFLKRGLKWILTMIIPVAFVGTVPVELATGKVEWNMLAVLPLNFLLVCGVLVVIWKRGKAHYESAN